MYAVRVQGSSELSYKISVVFQAIAEIISWASRGGIFVSRTTVNLAMSCGGGYGLFRSLHPRPESFWLGRPFRLSSRARSHGPLRDQGKKRHPQLQVKNSTDEETFNMQSKPFLS